MEAMIQRIPGVLTPLRKSQLYSYTNPLFVDAITLIEMPKKLSFPNMKLYDDTIDPTNHIVSYKQIIFTATIPCNLREACMCKRFGSSLMGPALQWYTNLPNNFISSFAYLLETFVEQFASIKKLEKLSGDLYRIQNVATSHFTTTLNASTEKRSPSLFVIKRSSSIPFERDSSLTMSSIRSLPSSTASLWKMSWLELGSELDGRKMSSIVVVARPTIAAVKNGVQATLLAGIPDFKLPLSRILLRATKEGIYTRH